MPEKGPSVLRGRSFQGLLWTQALSAFNDNSFKTLVALHAVASMDARSSSRLISLAGALFILPFVLFSTYAGDVSDAYGKKRLLVLLKWAELALMLGGFAALYARSLP
ncbi:MAG TPA: hypothetical protein VNI01_03680, partial [Elusimicrobiota bacterium]|nr:hypothetical protein [Elusimicrobiota bacterium]